MRTRRTEVALVDRFDGVNKQFVKNRLLLLYIYCRAIANAI